MGGGGNSGGELIEKDRIKNETIKEAKCLT